MIIGAIIIAAASCGPNITTADSYTICAEKQQQQASSSASQSDIYTPKPKPMRLCRYYVNNSIDVPTAGIISAWVPVGSRECIGDEPPEQTAPTQPKTTVVKTSVAETLTAFANRPVASWSPGSEIQIFQSGFFSVAVNNRTASGQLFEEPAQIRFTASSIEWQFSDGVSRPGASVARSFDRVGEYSAIAIVTYRVDYQVAGESWVIGATSISLQSNQLKIEVVEPPRRSLLVE
ncbi:MAG: hypothetical protein P8M68_00090 [Aquiluna sp.]|nr:hypothetical protein [Aquiluna sp.]